MTFEEILRIIEHLSVWEIVKTFVLLSLFVYIIFSWLVVRQVSLMIATLDGIGKTPIKLVAWLQLVLAIVVFLMAIIIL